MTNIVEKVLTKNEIQDVIDNISLTMGSFHKGYIHRATELIVDAIYEKLPYKTDHADGQCYYCGEMTSIYAANPGMWPIHFPHKSEPGRVKHHHTKCVMERLPKDE